MKYYYYTYKIDIRELYHLKLILVYTPCQYMLSFTNIEPKLSPNIQKVSTLAGEKPCGGHGPMPDNKKKAS